MAEPRTYTEVEHDAILVSTVERETASLTSERDALQTKHDEQASRLEIVEAEKAAAVTRAEAAEKALADFKSEQEAEKAAVERRQARRDSMHEVAASLGDEWFTDERVERWARMSDEDFTAQRTEIAEIASKVVGGGQKAQPLPAETAMQGTQGTEGQAGHRAGRLLSMRRGIEREGS